MPLIVRACNSPDWRCRPGTGQPRASLQNEAGSNRPRPAQLARQASPHCRPRGHSCYPDRPAKSPQDDAHDALFLRRLKASRLPKPFTAPLAHGPSREMNCSDASVPPLHRVASCSQRQMLPAPDAASTGGLGRCFAADEEASYDAVIGPGRCFATDYEASYDAVLAASQRL